MNKSMRQIAYVTIGILTLAIGFQNCTKQSLNTSEVALSNLGFGTVVQPPPDETVCGAFDASGQSIANCDVKHAFTGNLFVEPRADLIPRVHGDPKNPIPAGADASIAGISRRDWLSGKTVNNVFTPYTIVATSFDTIVNPFANGFTTQSGDTVTIPAADGSTTAVSAWFALRMDAVFHLAPGDTANVAYQFAVISDDGARIYFGPGLDLIVDNETPQTAVNPGNYIPGTQYPRMGCSSGFNDASTIKTFTLAADQTMPLRLTYFQGPQGLSLRLMYRAVPSAGADDAYCETDVDGGTSDKATTVKASPILKPDDVASHGWKVIKAENLGAL